MRIAVEMFSFDPNLTRAKKCLVLFYLFTLWVFPSQIRNTELTKNITILNPKNCYQAFGNMI
jgi:hypothetical protein